MRKRRHDQFTGIRIIGLLGIVLSMVSMVMAPAVSAQGKTTVYPGAVSITAGSCVNGVPGSATVSVPSDTTTDGIFYVITQPDAEGNFKVTAQVGDAYQMAAVPGNGWTTTNQWNAFYTGVAPIPNCSGPSQQSTTTTATTGNGVSVFALPETCGPAPYPAPTGADVTSQLSFSNYVITQNGVAHTSGPISLSSPEEVITLSFDWDANTLVEPGQYFTFTGPLDTNMNKVFASPRQWFPVWNSDGTHQAGCATVENGDITVQFTGYVSNRVGLGGNLELELEMYAGRTVETNTIEFTFDDESDFSITIPGTPTNAFGKRGWFERDDQGIVDPIGAIEWSLYVPASVEGYRNLVLSDVAPTSGGWTFSCAGPAATKVSYTAVDGRGRTVSLDFTEQCTATSMTLTVPTVPANTSVNFYFSADITSDAEGPFYNTATATADNITTRELPYEIRRTVGNANADGVFVVTPIPPAITHAACVDEVNDTWRPANVILPPNQEGVTYTMTPNPFPETGGHLVVIATLSEGYTWSDTTNGFVLDTTNGTMVYETDVTNDPCVVETPTITPTPDYPCIPPTPEVCIPTPTPEGEVTPTPGGETPPPCEPGPTPTVPAWCLVTPTPPTVKELPKTGSSQSDSNGTLIAAGMLVATVTVAAGAIVYRERAR